ncbi:MAG: hypothetical protein FWD11_02045 [Micrococcales bacterium]|nr:hypothetical protein [Micrococcales bacterium]
MTHPTFPVPVGAIDDSYLADLVEAVAARWAPPEPFADLLLSLTDEQSTALLAWSGAGLQTMIDQGGLAVMDGRTVATDTSVAYEVRNLQSAIRFWHEPRAAVCVRMLTRDRAWVAPRLLLAKMLRQGAAWASGVVDGLLRPRNGDTRLFGVVVSAVRYFDLPLPASDRFLVLWAQTFADLPEWRWLWTVGPDGQVTADEPVGPDGFLLATPHLEQVVCQVIGTPSALQAVHLSEELSSTAFSSTVAEAVASGLLARQPVLDAVFDALDSTSYAPAAQRVLANLLRGLDLT